MGKEELVSYLLKLSEGKLFLIKQLLTLTEQQSQSLESEEFGKLDEIIEQKQSIINRIDTLDKEFVEKYETLKKDFVFDNLEDLQADGKNNMKFLKGKISEIQIITEKIQKIDDANVERLRKKMELVKKELKKVKIGQKVMKGYANNTKEGISIFVDEKQ